MFRSKDAEKAYYKRYWIEKKSSKPHLLNTYGITVDDYNDLFAFQEGKCAGCKRHQSEFTKALCVDHCHTTGKVRGLLCSNCNSVLAYSNDDIDILKEMINYLQK